ncbi:MAG: universal stress protein [Gammaproteobacteria bacterium]|nr:universal stress protein [Gammaproteobacteria bacterium]MBV8307286.1 universal stress protein [Gammaproteobacteria bacterium]
MLQPVRRILAAVKDPAAPLLPAVTKATQLAQAFGAELEIFHAIDAAVYVDMLGTGVCRLKQLEAEERSDYLQRLERIAARARLHAPCVTVAAEWDFPAYEAIVRRALETRADLLVAECHPGRHRAQSLMRLADWELLRLCPIPVLLVKRVRPYHRPTIVAAVDPGQAAGKPAVLDEQILRLAAQFSNALQGGLHVAHAYDARGSAEPNAASAQLGLESLVARAEVLPSGCHLLGGAVHEELDQLACRLPADILVAGSVSRSGLQKAMIGNTAEWLLRHLACDLLILKPPQFANRVPLGRAGVRHVTVEPLG